MSLPFSAMMRTTPSFSSYVSLSVFAVKSTRSPRAFLNQMRKTAFSAIVTIPPARYEVVSDLAWSPTILRYSMRQIARIIAVAAVLCILGSPALAAASVPARYQLRGHLPDLGERPTMRAFLTQAAYDAYRSSLGDANVFPKGLILGRVLKVKRDKTYSQSSAEVAPAAHLEQLSAVWVRVKN